MIKVVKILLDDPKVASGRSSQRFLYVELVGEKGARLPVNLALILDQSLSMHGEPIRKVKEAVENLLRYLHRQGIVHRVSIIAYNHEARILVPNTEKPNPGTLIGVLKNILNVGGGTCIEAGMELAVSQMEKAHIQKYVNHAFLLTDGLNEHGEDEECLRIAREAFKRGIVFHSFGFGDRWDPDLMERICTVGRGYLKYIKTPADVSLFFHNVLSKLLETSAKNLRLCLSVPKDKVSTPDTNAGFIVKPERISITPRSSIIFNTDTKILEFALGDLSSEEHRAAMAQLVFKVDGYGDMDIGRILVLYDNPDLGISDIEGFDAKLTVQCMDEEYQYQPSPEMTKEILGISLYLQNEMAYELMKAGKRPEALQMLEAARTTCVQLGDEKVATQLQSASNILKKGGSRSREEIISTKMAIKTRTE